MKTSRSAYALLLPVCLLYCGLFVAPFFWFLAVSFYRMSNYRLQAAFSVENYAKVLTTNLGTVGFTVGLAACVAIVTVSAGFVYAWFVRFKAGRFADAFLLVAVLTLFGGYLMKIYAWKTILGNEGVINSGLLVSGIIAEPLTWLLYTPFAVIVTLVHFLLPFAVLPIYASLRGISDTELEAARDLGASPVALFRSIIVPRAKAGISAAFALCFLVSSGDYVTATLVGGKLTMMGNLIAPQFGTFFNWPMGAAMSFTTLAASAIVLGVLLAILGRIGIR